MYPVVTSGGGVASMGSGLRGRGGKKNGRDGGGWVGRVGGDLSPSAYIRPSEFPHVDRPRRAGAQYTSLWRWLVSGTCETVVIHCQVVNRYGQR